MYHRIAEPPYDPWGLCVSPRRFAEHLSLLTRLRHVLPMEEFVAGLKAGTLSPKAVAITFDDGYLDNLVTAGPLIEKIGVSATLFVTTATLGQRCPFWWDDLAHMTLGRMPGYDAAITLDGTSIPVRFEAVGQPTQLRTRWRGWQPARTGREKAYFDLWSLLRKLDSVERQDAMTAISRCLGGRSEIQSDPTMSAADLARLARGGYMDIGGHTRTHPPLTTISLAERREEIVTGRSDCIQLVAGPVTGFAYPHGDLDEETKDIVREAGYAWACTTESAAVKPLHFDLHALPRLQALDISGFGLWFQMRMAMR
jgi:peptidoglycan/xylan/chitin deacetylase (PgdA/CDA1 family)